MISCDWLQYMTELVEIQCVLLCDVGIIYTLYIESRGNTGIRWPINKPSAESLSSCHHCHQTMPTAHSAALTLTLCYTTHGITHKEWEPGQL